MQTLKTEYLRAEGARITGELGKAADLSLEELPGVLSVIVNEAVFSSHPEYAFLDNVLETNHCIGTLVLIQKRPPSSSAASSRPGRRQSCPFTRPSRPRRACPNDRIHYNLLLSSSMHFHSCSQHARPLDRLCGLGHCCLLLCELCLPEHSGLSGHRTALLLAPQTLTFFESFTGYTHYKMFDWLDCIRRHGFSALFEAGPEADGEWLTGQEQQLTALSLKVLEDFQRLAQNNRQFVLNNRHSQSLYHPEFLRDLFTLATEQWAVSAQLILDNLARLAADQYPQQQLPSFSILPQFIEPIEAYRAQLIGKIRRQVVLGSFGPSPAENATMEQGSLPLEAEQYELPYSIKQI